MIDKKTFKDFEIWYSTELIPYDYALAQMEQRRQELEKREALPTLWLLMHDDLYTAGRRTQPDHLAINTNIPIYSVNRGGKLTYHGPGQLMGYCMVDLNHANRNIHAFIQHLETYLIQLLHALNIPAISDRENIGIWTAPPFHKAKIASLGIHVRKWITTHGFALNINPDLNHFKAIVPCGLQDVEMTSVIKLHPTLDPLSVINLAKELAPMLLIPYTNSG